MPYIIVIDKTGTIKETNIKEYKESELYKKANFKSAEGFLLQTQWESVTSDKKKTFNIAVYGKTNGKAGQENKYEFPPPIDSVLFFGGCVLIAKKDEHTIQDLRISDWISIYDTLMGGFDDIGEEDGDDLDDEIDTTGLKIGKDGYERDDFVVEDDDIDYDELSVAEEDVSEEEEVVPVPQKSKSKKEKTTGSGSGSSNKRKTAEPVSVPEMYLDCQSELVAEEYM